MSSEKKITRNEQSPFLVGSTFPLTLIRRKIIISPESLQELKIQLRHRPFSSFWGHQNTIRAAGALLGVDIAPLSARPVIQLDDDNFPTLHGEKFDECWVLSPDYPPGFRPAIGEEVADDKIIGWQVLKIKWACFSDNTCQ